MRKLFTAIALLASASGCAMNGSQTSHAPIHRPLNAYISPPAGNGAMGFQLSKPAYVAVFEVVPGAGTSLVFPRPGTGPVNQRWYAGYHSIPLQFINQRTRYQTISRIGWEMGIENTPRYYFLLASEEPLQVDGFGPYGMGLRTSMGYRHFASLNAFDAMERLVELSVPTPAANRWTADYFVHWPDVLHRQPSRHLLQVTCNGEVFWIDAGYINAFNTMVCPSGSEDQNDQADPRRDGAEEGQRRPPVDEQKTESVRERIIQASTGSGDREAREDAPRRPTLEPSSRAGSAEPRSTATPRSTMPDLRRRNPAIPSTGTRPATRPSTGSATPARPSTGSATPSTPSRRSGTPVKPQSDGGSSRR